MSPSKKSMDYKSKFFFGGHEPLVQTQIPITNFIRPTFKEPLKKLPTIPTHIVHTCHVGFHVDSSSTEVVMGSASKVLSCKPTTGVHVTLSGWKVKDSQEPWPNGFRVNIPLNLLIHFWWPMKRFQQVRNNNEVRFYLVLKIQTLFTTTSYT